MAMDGPRFLLVSLPYQSHINPALRLADKLIRVGARVTFVTTVNGLNKIKTRPSIDGLTYDSFSDGHDDDDGAVGKPGYAQEIRRVGLMSLRNLLLKEGQKVDFIIYGICLPWVAEVARELHVSSALFFIQSAAAFSVLYHFFKSDGGFANTNFDLTGTLNLPGLPLFEYSEIPSYIVPTDPDSRFASPVFQEHIQTLEKHPNPFVVINTFDALEEESIKPILDHIKIFSVGPLVPAETGKPFVCDLFPSSDRETYLRWLDSKPEKSVIYVSFGSFVELEKKQKEEIYQGLVEAGRPFLWVIRSHGEDDEAVKGYNAEGGGLILRWCSQVEVLNHVAVGCFVTHCGWNSLVESMVGGAALVGCPQFAEQKMNMKMVEEVWGNGVKAVADGEGVVGREEIKRCLEVVMGGGERGEEIKRNCEKLRRMAMAAMDESGSSHTNLKEFFKCV